MGKIYLYSNNIKYKETFFNLPLLIDSDCRDIKIEIVHNELINKIQNCTITDTKQNITYTTTKDDLDYWGNNTIELLEFDSYYKLYIKDDCFTFKSLSIDKFKSKTEQIQLKNLSTPYIKIIQEELKNKEIHKAEIDNNKLTRGDYGILGKYKRVAKSRCIEYFLTTNINLFEQYNGFLSKTIIQNTLKNNLDKQPNNTVVLKLLKSINYSNHISKNQLTYDIKKLQEYLFNINLDYQTLIFVFKQFDTYF